MMRKQPPKEKPKTPEPPAIPPSKEYDTFFCYKTDKDYTATGRMKTDHGEENFGTIKGTLTDVVTQLALAITTKPVHFIHNGHPVTPGQYWTLEEMNTLKIELNAKRVEYREESIITPSGSFLYLLKLGGIKPPVHDTPVKIAEQKQDNPPLEWFKRP